MISRVWVVVSGMISNLNKSSNQYLDHLYPHGQCVPIRCVYDISLRIDIEENFERIKPDWENSGGGLLD